jgi:hypothetical protein
MYGTVITAAIALSGATPSDSAWDIPCVCPLDLLIRDLRSQPQPKWPVPGSPVVTKGDKRPWVSVSLFPDIVSFEEMGYRPGRSYSFSTVTSSRGLKGALLQRLGLIEMRSRGFGATLRFADAPNWAFQFKGTKQVTVAYITRF